jgi:hypothetical protein
MKTQTHHRPTRALDAGWLPPAPARALDLNRWQSRAARGHTWNADASTRRRRTH